MPEGADQLRKVAAAILKDVSKMVDRHGPRLRRAAGDVLEKDIPKAVAAVRKELPDLEKQIRKELRNLRRR